MKLLLLLTLCATAWAQNGFDESRPDRTLPPGRTGDVKLSELAPDVTEAVFDDVWIVANWSADRPYLVDGMNIAPGGCLVRSRNLLAGVFVQSFNGELLTEGPHYLVIERKGDSLEISQPIGEDTGLTLSIPRERGVKLEVVAVGSDGRVAATGFIERKQGVSFRYKRTAGDITVDHYEIRKVHIKFM